MREEDVVLRDGRAVRIRPARIEDADSLLENIALIGAEEVYVMIDTPSHDPEAEREWVRSFDGQRSALFVADAAGAVVGAADCHGGAYPKNRHVGDLGIAIRDGWREVGLGRVLMERVLDWMRARGFEKATLCVFATNVRARRLYESLGFRTEGVRRKQIRIRGELVDEVFMALWLDGSDG